jgi:hypothetical protein
LKAKRVEGNKEGARKREGAPRVPPCNMRACVDRGRGTNNDAFRFHSRMAHMQARHLEKLR